MLASRNNRDKLNNSEAVHKRGLSGAEPLAKTPTIRATPTEAIPRLPQCAIHGFVVGGAWAMAARS